ncbi:MAG: hypothetical protein JXP73_20115 [Deltaproteobacteria bacterium]|nr:hypothetical protein [Deltaproteobacteria bacterium]
MSRCRLLSVFLPLLGLASACSSTPTVIPTRNLDRPTDMAFVCLGMVAADASGTTLLSGQGMDACHPRTAVDPDILANGQRTLGTFAFITNVGRGELAVADMDSGRLLDLAPEVPGYGMLPVGGNPETVVASQDGCWVMTASRSSCSLSLVDPARLLARTFSTSSTPAEPATGPGEVARRLVVHTGAGRALDVSVGEIAFLPPAVTAPTCGAAALPRAVATFPGCDMVAVLELSFEAATARIVDAYYVRPDLPGGALAAGSEPICPDDCSPPSGKDDAVLVRDGGAGALDGGGREGIDAGAVSGQPPFYLHPLALVPDGTRVYVGSLLDTAVTSLDIAGSAMGHPVRVTLAESPGGVTRLRLGIDPHLTAQVLRPDGSTGTVTGQFLHDRGSFLYVFASDASIRVLDIGGEAPVECDVNIPVTSDRACFPVGTPGRRPLAAGPGIRIPTFANPDSPPPLPRDLAFVDLRPTENDGNYHALSGQFAFVLAANGQVYVLNLAPNGENGTATHSFRESRDVGKNTRTPIAVSIAPQRSVVQSDQAFATTASFSAMEGPLIESFLSDGVATPSWFGFPDPDNVVSRRWDIVWEGVLPLTTRGSGVVESAAAGEVAGRLFDAGADFCRSGVRIGDILMFSGCTQNSECQPDDEFTCQVTVSGARGMCLPKQASSSTGIVDQCVRFMGSRMRYEVAQAMTDSLALRLKLDEVPKTTLNPCTQDSDCRPDVDHGKLSSGNPDGGGRQPFACLEVRPQERRCVQRCHPENGDSDCRAGHVCELVPWVLPEVGPLCVEAPPIDARCFPQPMTAYSVRAGHAFMVYGSSMPSLLHTARVAPDGNCQYDAGPDPALVDRIPLLAPPCPDSFLSQVREAEKDPLTGAEISPAVHVQDLAAQAGSNPCLYRTASSGGGQSPDGGAPSDQPIRAFFQNPQIRFVLTNLDAYAGDLLAIHFEFQYGFVPLTVQIPSYEVQLTMGTRILTGPTKTPESPLRHVPPTADISYPYLYVVDQGRTALTPGSKGQVLRINPRAGSNEIVVFDTTMSGSTPFQLQ